MKRAQWVSCLTSAALVLSAATASADFSITGEWFSNRGPTINIPPGGNDIPCPTAATFNQPPLTATRANAPCHRVQTPPFTVGGFPVPAAVTVVQAESGVNAAPQIVPAATATPNAVGDRFEVPAQAFFRDQPSIAPVPKSPAVQQLDTSFVHVAPATSRQATPAGVPVSPSAAVIGQRPAVPGATRVMDTNAWQKPGQTARMAADFNWTTNAVSPASPNPTRRVTYNAGPQAFGGTMHKLISGTAIVWIVADIVAQIPGNEVGLSPIGQNDGILRPQVAGRGYLTSTNRLGQNLQLFRDYNIPVPCTQVVPPAPAGCDLLTAVGYPLGSVAGTPQTLNVGFPFTTGHVSVYGRGTRQGIPVTTTLTAQGSDTVTPGGVRTVQLVAGAMAQRNNPAIGGLQPPTTNLETVTIQLPEPGTALMFAGAFTVIGGLFASRKRLF